jgi:hypothetical protein
MGSKGNIYIDIDFEGPITLNSKSCRVQVEFEALVRLVVDDILAQWTNYMPTT